MTKAMSEPKMEPRPIDKHIVEGRPESKYSANCLCPICGLRNDEIKKPQKITIYRLPKPETYRGITPKDGAIEYHCDCGFVYWGHYPLDFRYDVYEGEEMVPPYKHKDPFEGVPESHRFCAWCVRCIDNKRYRRSECNVHVPFLIEHPKAELHCTDGQYFVYAGGD